MPSILYVYTIASERGKVKEKRGINNLIRILKLGPDSYGMEEKDIQV